MSAIKSVLSSVSTAAVITRFGLFSTRVSPVIGGIGFSLTIGNLLTACVSCCEQETLTHEVKVVSAACLLTGLGTKVFEIGLGMDTQSAAGMAALSFISANLLLKVYMKLIQDSRAVNQASLLERVSKKPK